MSEKLCVSCKWCSVQNRLIQFISDEYRFRCKRPGLVVLPPASKVSGKRRKPSSPPSCSDERLDWDYKETCGSKAKYWEDRNG